MPSVFSVLIVSGRYPSPQGGAGAYFAARFSRRRSLTG